MMTVIRNLLMPMAIFSTPIGLLMVGCSPGFGLSLSRLEVSTGRFCLGLLFPVSRLVVTPFEFSLCLETFDLFLCGSPSLHFWGARFWQGIENAGK